jgi:hypothetical protein
VDAVDVIGLRLSAQRALLGAVGDGLYGACVDVRNGTVVVTWYIARGISGDERESLEVAGTEIIADFPSDVGLDEQFIEVRDTSAPLPTVGTWVFLRRGFRTITAHRMEDAGDRLDTSVYSGHEPVDIRACRGPRPHSVFREHAIPEGLFVRAVYVASAYELHLLPTLDQYGPYELSKEQARTLADEARLIRTVLSDDVLDPHLAAIHDVALWCAHSPADASILIEGP